MVYNNLSFTEIKKPTESGTKHDFKFVVLEKPAHPRIHAINALNLPKSVEDPTLIIENLISAIISATETGFIAGLERGLKDKQMIDTAVAAFKSENCFCIHISFNRISDDVVIVAHDTVVEKLESFKPSVSLSVIK